MSSTLIGTLLDEALFQVKTSDPGRAVSRFAAGSTDRYGQPWTPRSAARSDLAKAVRKRLAAECDPPRFCARSVIVKDERNPTYLDLIGLPKFFNKIDTPDLIVRDGFGKPIAAVEIGYGFEVASALAVVDRLLNFLWFARARPALFKRLDQIAYLFIHEREPRESIRETEQRINDWIGEHYGPFKGSDRIMLPMTPRLTRSDYISAGGPPRVSATGLKGNLSGYIAFCVSYQVDQP